MTRLTSTGRRAQLQPAGVSGVATAKVSKTPDDVVRDIGPAIVAAREDARLTQDDVAEALGVSRQMVGYWETGRRTPRHEHLLGLARVYGRSSVSDLLTRPDQVEQPVAAADSAKMLYRRSSVDLDDNARVGLSNFIAFLDFYASLAKHAKVDIGGMKASPFLPGEGYAEYDVDARRKASEVRSHLALGQGPIADVDTVCATLGITVYRAHLGNDLNNTISGAYYRHPDVGFTIIVNLDMTRGRRRFTAAHELAHALLHSGTDGIIVSDAGRRGEQREKFADAFAGEFLMPEEGIRRALESLGYGPKIEDVEPVIHLQRMFNVSYITALVRLRQANIISRASLDQLRKVPPTTTAERLGYQPDWAEGPMDPELSVSARYPLRFRSLLRRCMTEDIVGTSEAQQALNLGPVEVEELVDQAAEPTDLNDQEWDEFNALGALA